MPALRGARSTGGCVRACRRRDAAAAALRHRAAEPVVGRVRPDRDPPGLAAGRGHGVVGADHVARRRHLGAAGRRVVRPHRCIGRERRPHVEVVRAVGRPRRAAGVVGDGDVQRARQLTRRRLGPVRQAARVGRSERQTCAARRDLARRLVREQRWAEVVLVVGAPSAPDIVAHRFSPSRPRSDAPRLAVPAARRAAHTSSSSCSLRPNALSISST